MKKLNPSNLISGLLALLALAWFITGVYGELRSVLSTLPYRPDQVGQMELAGKASAIDAQLIEISPVSETSCIAYEFLVKKYNQGSNHSHSYHTVLKERQGLENLSIQTPTGPVQIKLKTFDLTHPYFEDQQYLNTEFEQPHTLLALKERNIGTSFIGLKEGIKVQESLIQAGDDIIVIGQHNSTNNPPILEEAIVSDKSVEHRVTNLKISLGSGLFLLLLIGGFWIKAIEDQ